MNLNILLIFAKNNVYFRYVTVGILNTLFSLAIYPILYVVLEPYDVGYLKILILAYIFTSLFSFFSQRHYVFATKNRIIKRYADFLVAQCLILILNLAILPVMVETTRLSPIILQSIFLVFIILFSFYWSKNIVFKS